MKKAFTLIELLIVVAILAILAIGVLAAIDPIEQFNRGIDSTVINSAAEYKNSLDRYYLARSSVPSTLAGGYSGTIILGAGYNSITEMITAGELKLNFTSPTAQISSVLLTLPAGATTTIVCSYLKSKTFRNNTNAIYATNGGTPVGTCPSPTNGTCSICLF